MRAPTKARIYLAEQRQHQIGAGYVGSKSVLSSPELPDELQIYDISLKESSPFFKPAFEDTLSIVMAQSSSVWIDADNATSVRIEEYEVAMLTIGEGEVISIQNPNFNMQAGFILIQLPAAEVTEFKKIDMFSSNGLQRTMVNECCYMYTGKFSGRQEGQLAVDERSVVHVFVLEGAFEFQNRLLQPRDALTLSGINNVEFEALSNEARLVVFVCS